MSLLVDANIVLTIVTFEIISTIKLSFVLKLKGQHNGTHETGNKQILM
jgi:hypothetical protein